MQNFQSIKDQMQGGIKFNQQKSNNLPPRNGPTKVEVVKSPNYKQNNKEYEYNVDEDKSPFQGGSKSNNLNKIDSLSSNKGNNIYNNKQSSKYNQKSSNYDEYDDELDSNNNQPYSVENYTKKQSGSSQYGSKNYDQKNQQQRKSIDKDLEEDDLYSNQDEYEQLNSHKVSHKTNANSYQRINSKYAQEESEYPQKQQQNKRATSANRIESQAEDPKQNNRMIQRYQKVEEGLTVCPEGCGRTFNEFALEKHVKVCKKVFQDKRKAFDITQKRQVAPQNEQIQKGDEQQRQEIMRKQKEMHECPDCGRSFRYDTYEKHVKICVRVFTKKNRENSLNRKASLNVTGSNQTQQLMSSQSQSNPQKLPPTSLVKKGSSIQNDNDQDVKNLKKPPLNRTQQQNEKKNIGKGSDWEETPVGASKSKNTWDETPIGGKSSQKAWEDTPVGGSTNKNKNAWEDTPVGASKSKNQQWDEYPSTQNTSVQSKGGKYTQEQSETSNNPWDNKKQVKKQSLPPKKKPEWNNDWNAPSEEDDAFTQKNKEMERQIQEQKNYNFNKKIKSAQSGSKYSIENPSDFEINQELDLHSHEDKYVYSKPNIGKKVIHSGKKSPINNSLKAQKQQVQAFNRAEDEDQEEYEQQQYTNKNPRNAVHNRQQTTGKSNLNKYNEQETYDKENEESSSQYSKPFLKKNQGNQAVSKSKKPQPETQSSSYTNYEQQGQEDIPISKNNQFNQQIVEMEKDVLQQDLIECPEGCGRKFAENILEKHAKVCKKVFQQKRRVFNSAAQRQLDEEEGGGVGIPSKIPPISKPLAKKQAPKNTKYENESKEDYGFRQNTGGDGKKPNQPFNKKPTDENTKVGKKKSKWQIQSEAFRAQMRMARGETTNSQYDNQIVKEAFENNDYIQCEYCGRKFNEQAAQRHIPFCKTKSQQNQIKQGGKAKLNLTTQKSSTPSSRKY
ncbi:zinc finger, C2H2 type protein (macronuclear) [Tetrahymena thermophila SB210]|uniref:Zinc finger, C2H2 type protein n=1 Tax=Tetrahymena thermophila (strain SB210) TaxID=312017 RepID=Q24HM2_TETTS|nr:zinc finger, C2H2 type protein [Tetrahymena thermophila SB210]EAS07289.2 zinc finger, C2H2 type protein [Tetrahymena thermophila SB210]|eukprot:XP_001027531.2 zinc finger, C2H2 type protein [Tetrahymena thermophila SB210]